MNETQFLQFSGWSAVINGIASIGSTVTLMLMFAVAAFFGPVNDAISVVWCLSFIPLALFFYRLNQPVNAPLSLIATIIGTAAMIIFAVAQALLVIGVVSFEQTMSLVLLLGAVIGLWALLNGFMAQNSGALPQTMSWLMIIFGLSFMITAVGWYRSGPENPLVMIGFLIGAIAGPVWTIWLGRMLMMADLGLRIAE